MRRLKTTTTAAPEPEPPLLPRQEPQYAVRHIAHAWPFPLSCPSGGGIFRNVPAAAPARQPTVTRASHEGADRAVAPAYARAIKGVRY